METALVTAATDSEQLTLIARNSGCSPVMLMAGEVLGHVEPLWDHKVLTK